jgi:hypothetical protein
MIYLNGRKNGIGFHVIDVHHIRCEYEFISSAIIFHLIHGEMIDDKFGNVQQILETSVDEFNPSFAGDLNWRVVPHKNRMTFACIQ